MDCVTTEDEKKPELKAKGCNSTYKKRAKNIRPGEKSTKKPKPEQKFESSPIKLTDLSKTKAIQNKVIETLIFKKQKEFFNSPKVLESLRYLINRKKKDCYPHL